MNWMLDLKIRYKILFLAVIGVGGFLVYFGFNYLVAADNAKRLASIRDVDYPILEKTDANLVRLDKLRETFNAAVVEMEEDLLDEADALTTDITQTFGDMITINPQKSQQISNIQQSFNHYFTVARQLTVSMIDESLDGGEMQAMAQEMRTALQTLQAELSEFRETSYATFTRLIEESDQAASHALMVGMIIGGVVLLSLLIATPLIISMITGNLSQVIISLKAMAAGGGDLTRRLESRSNDELGELAQWFNRFVEQLQSVVAELKDAGVQLSASASEVAIVTEQSSRHVANQESETELVATAVNQMAATVQEVASHANNAANASQEADQEARGGQKTVAETVDAIDTLAEDIDNTAEVIHQLEADSQEIGTVLDVIRGIAEQTNLLALNAAIEAARAGDQGRGFAVVADEVRTLAGRTQQATEKIDQMIEHLQSGSRNGVTVMNASRDQAKMLVGRSARAGESLQSITQAVGNISDMNLQIASATDEQSNVAAGIDASIVKIRDIGVETARGAAQASASSKKMAQLAGKVQELLEQFRV
ncbi:MAG: methyl-accepting chemotaxis protein [Gammaproteobacteria bacterium]|nr:methyl-accepting chemotaxis protein [Gammaproteobacteria bacterium]